MKGNQAKADRLHDDSTLGMLLVVWLYRILLVLMMVGGVVWLKSLPHGLNAGESIVMLTVYTALLVVMQNVYRACDVGRAHVSEMVMSQSLANLFTMALIYLGEALYAHQFFNPLPLLAVLAAQILLGAAWSLIANHIYFRTRRAPRTAIVYRSEEELNKLYQTPYFSTKYEVCKLIAAADKDVEAIREEIEGYEVIFAIGIPAALTNGLAKLCLEKGIKGYFVPRLGHIVMAGAEHVSTFSMPMLRVQRAAQHSEYRVFKRMFDFVASLAGAIVASPIMALTALAIKLEDGGPVFYRQVRLTKNGREFRIIKFRSMRVNAEQDGVARLAGENDSRITKVGKFIRACRIDELPQLFNIILGDMSIVGPRPERPEIARQYEQELPEFPLRLQVKAGLTGLAQVYGRYNTEPYNKLQMDLMYINEMSLLKDLQLILTTVKIMFIKESTQGVTADQTTALGVARDKCNLSA